MMFAPENYDLLMAYLDFDIQISHDGKRFSVMRCPEWCPRSEMSIGYFGGSELMDDIREIWSRHGSHIHLLTLEEDDG